MSRRRRKNSEPVPVDTATSAPTSTPTPPSVSTPAQLSFPKRLYYTTSSEARAVTVRDFIYTAHSGVESLFDESFFNSLLFMGGVLLFIGCIMLGIFWGVTPRTAPLVTPRQIISPPGRHFSVPLSYASSNHWGTPMKTIEDMLCESWGYFELPKGDTGLNITYLPTPRILMGIIPEHPTVLEISYQCIGGILVYHDYLVVGPSVVEWGTGAPHEITPAVVLSDTAGLSCINRVLLVFVLGILAIGYNVFLAIVLLEWHAAARRRACSVVREIMRDHDSQLIGGPPVSVARD